MRIKKIHYLISLLLGSLLSACPSPNLSNETTTTIISASSSSSTSIFSNKKPINRGLHGALPSTDPNQNSTNNISNDPYTYATSSSPPVYYSSNLYPSVAASASTYRPDLPASAAPSSSGNSGTIDTEGTTTSIRENATFNGGIYDNNGLPVNGVKVTAQSIDPAINWKGEDQITSNGSYVFRNAPVGVRIVVSVTVNGVTKSQTQVLKSNLTGDSNANRIDFNNVYSTDYRPLEGKIYDANQNLITSDVEVIGESTDTSNPWNSKAEFNNGLYKFSQIPIGVKNIKITVKAKGKEVSRTYTYNDSLAYNYVNFGGSESQDKTFAIQRFRIKDLATGINLFKNTSEEAESTFATDVDTASYTLMRNSINNANSLPSQDSVRIEDYINYFDYEYPKPQKSFSINTEIAQSPFVKDSTKKILRIGLQGKEIKIENRKDAIITFVIDSSGSMEENSKLENIKNSIKIFLKQLTPKDRISIVSYNYSAKVIVDNLDISKENEILEAIDKLQPDGGTEIESGLIKGSEIAQKNYIKGAINRILLCSDGANNDLKKDPKIILENIKKQSEVSGISFSSIGVGFNTYNDSFLEEVAKNGDGYYAYIDNVKEAVKVFVENATDTLQVIAKDAKVQVKFNPKVVKSYRLIGYEHNILPTNDFRNNNINAGEIGPNHSVTALYEIETTNNASTSDKIADVIMRYKDIDLNEAVIELSKPVLAKDINLSFKDSSYSFKLASVVALYGEILRGSYWSLDNKFEDVLDEIKALENVKNNDKLSELKKLVEKAKSIKNSL